MGLVNNLPDEREVILKEIKDVLEEHRSLLIRVFTYYCSYGEPLNTNKMRSSKFIKFLKDARIIA